MSKKKQFIIDFIDKLDEDFQPIDKETIKEAIEEALEETFAITITNIAIKDVDPIKESISVEDVLKERKERVSPTEDALLTGIEMMEKKTGEVANGFIDSLDKDKK